MNAGMNKHCCGWKKRRVYTITKFGKALCAAVQRVLLLLFQPLNPSEWLW